MAEVGVIEARFTGDASGLEAAADRARGAFRRVGEAAAAVGLGVTFADITRQLIQFGANVIRIGDQLSDLSEQTNISIATLGGLRIAAEQSGTSIDAVARSSQMLIRNLAEGADGTGRQAEALKRLGLSTSDLGKYFNDTEGFLERVAQGLGALKTRSEQAAVAQALLGRSAGMLLPILLRIANEGLPKVSKEAEAGYKALGELADKSVELGGKAADAIARYVRQFQLAFSLGAPATATERTRQIETEIEQLRRYRDLQAQGGPRGIGETLEYGILRDKVARAARGNAAKGPLALEEKEITAAIEERIQVIRELNRTVSAEGRPPSASPYAFAADTKKLDTFIDSLKKQAIAAEAEAKALSVGESEALRWKLTHEAMAELNTTKLSPSIVALIDKIVKLNDQASYARLKKAFDEIQIQEQTEKQDKFTKALEDFDAVLESLAAGGLSEFEKQLKDINDQQDALIARLLEYKRLTGRDVAPQIADVERIRAERLRGVERPKSPTEQVIGDIEGRNRSIATQEEVFRRAGISYSAAREKLEAYQQVLAGLGPDVDLSNVKIQEAIDEYGRLNKQLEFTDNVKSIVASGFSSIENSIRGFQQGTKKASDIFKDFALTVISGIADMSIKLLILKPIMEEIEKLLSSSKSGGSSGGFGGGGLLSAAGGLLSGLLGGGGGSAVGFGSAPAGVAGPLLENGGFFSNIVGAVGSFFGFAEGGVVPGPLGAPQLAVVHGGEEVLTPGQRSGGGVVYNIDARGAQRGVSREIMAAIEQSKRSAVQESVAQVQDMRRRSSNFAKTFK